MDHPFAGGRSSTALLRAGIPVNTDRRLMLWQIHEGMHCSIVGTCLDRKDIPTLMRKAKLRAVDGSTDYEQHAWFVCQVVSESPLSRYTHRLLDRKFAGALRRYGKLHDEDAVLAYWEDARRGGDLAGAYWAIASHSRTDEDLRRRVFGDVHMMSHFMIGRNRQDARTLTVAEERMQQLEERLVRVRERQTAALQQRKERIEELEREAVRLRALAERRAPAAGPIRSGAGSCKTARSLEAQRRRVVAAKALLREARAENEQLRSKLALLLDDPGPAAAPVRQQAATEPDSCMRRWLYIGGRIKAQAHLRRGAESCRACLFFHDGGMEKNLKGLDDLVAQADMVFCPMDCVSHGACVLAKRLCRRFDKPFVPLRTSSSSHFRTVAARIAATIDGKSELPAIVTIGLREGEEAACS